MRYLLVLLSVTGILIMAGCSGILPLGKTPVQLGQELINKFVEALKKPDEFPDPDSSPTEFVNFALDFVYVPVDDRNDSDVPDGVGYALELIVFSFPFSATVTQATVLAATEHSVKFPQLLSNPPNFVDKVYTLTIQCTTEDGTKTSVTVPMITIQGQDSGYFYTIFIKDTGPATAVWIYPQPFFPS
ncbi:MAG: hypothetical protein ACPLVG_08220 [Pseudothermotoga sp.]